MRKLARYDVQSVAPKGENRFTREPIGSKMMRSRAPAGPDGGCEEFQMSKTRVVVKHGEGETLQVLGAGLRFLCGADKTEGAWSLMEAEVPERTGAPPHHHPWDEAYYILDGKITFVVDGKEQTLSAGDFVYLPAGTQHGFQGASPRPAR